MDLNNCCDVLHNVICGHGAAETEICKAEKALGVSFASDYRSFIQRYSCISSDEHEICGISDMNVYDVVYLTLKWRKIKQQIPSGWYVIEQLNIDDVIVWQTPQGEIYQTGPNDTWKLIAKSFYEYISH